MNLDDGVAPWGRGLASGSFEGVEMKGPVAWLAIAACGLWVLAVSLLVMETVTALSPHLSDWALMVGLWACVATGWALLLNERSRVHTIAEMAAAAMLEHQGLKSVD